MEKRTINPKKYTDTKYVADTSVIVNRKLTRLAKKGLKGLLFIPNAAVAELENLANRGRKEGIKGLEELAKLHKFKTIQLKFIGPRPSEHQIRYAKSGEIDALIRSLANKYKATLITSDKVQAKSAEAYGLKTIFQRVIVKKKKRFFFFRK